MAQVHAGQGVKTHPASCMKSTERDGDFMDEEAEDSQLPDLVEEPSKIMSEDEVEGLISFTSLETVMKNISRKFKKLELSSKRTAAAMHDLHQQIAKLATIDALDAAIQELIRKFYIVDNLLAGNGERLIDIQERLAQNGVTTMQHSQRLDELMKELSSQNANLQEFHCMLQNKASVADLDLLEGKLSEYTTTAEHKVLHDLVTCNYADLHVTDSLAANLQALDARFADYSPITSTSEQLNELQSWVENQLQDYALAAATSEAINKLQMLIDSQSSTEKHNVASIYARLQSLTERIASVYSELNDDVRRRALTSDLRSMNRELRRYALRVETESFQQDFAPKLEYCIESVQGVMSSIEAQEEALKRLDEVVLDKAAKYDIVMTNARLEKCIQQSAAEKEFENLQQKIQILSDSLNRYITHETQRFLENRPTDYTPKINEIHKRLEHKADKSDMQEMYRLKANSTQIDEVRKIQNQFRKQLEYLAMTTANFSKVMIGGEAKLGDSKASRAQLRQLAMKKVDAAWHWVKQNEVPEEASEPPTIPEELQETNHLETHSQDANTQEQLPALSISGNSAVSDAEREKRLVTTYKRMFLERKLGV